MFLKSLELRGFKSFSDKTELVFKKGITAIVGPNGSGKSNISDAVRWVLGEQSIKSLRGGKMQDVIFSGTEFRKPVGLAQVSLILDNSDGELPIDYTEVIIMRRIYRSGESEYFINSTKCRLKDIHELFMDTGIGKEGYSIIGQGKIEAVLSGKPEERRSLLEEAAGIVKFKTRKEEAERRLENTNLNIQRINDIFSTYEDRIEPLRQENEKAKQFLEISQKLKRKEVTLILNSIDNLDSKVESIKASISENEEKLNSIILNRDGYKENIEQLKEKLEQFELENNEERKKYYDCKSEHQRLLSEIDLLNERVKNFTNIINRANKNREDLEEKYNTLIKEKEICLSALKELTEKQLYLNNDIHSKNDLLVEKDKIIADTVNKINMLKNSQSAFMNEISQNSYKITIMQNDISGFESKIEELKSSCEAYFNSISINESTKEVLKEEVEIINEKIRNHEETIKQNKIELIKKSNKLQTKEDKLKDLSTIYSKTEANLDALINLEKQHEGYNKSVKMLMQSIDGDKVLRAKNNTWILGEIITVAKEFETAIEVALGASISNIVTGDEKIAKSLINYLKENNLGRATFLPLTIINGKKISVPLSIKNINGFVGIASELVQADEKFINILEYTLGRTLISKDMESALNIAKETKYSFKIVTLTGEVVNIGGALTGGSLYNKNLNIIGRKRHIEELTSDLNKYKNQISELSDLVNEDKLQIKNIDNICLNLKDVIYSENIEKTKMDEKIIAIDNETEKLKRSLEVSKNEEVIVLEIIRNNTNDISQFEDTIEKLEIQKKNISDEIIELEILLEKENAYVSQINDNITELKISKAQIDEIIFNRGNEIKRLESEISHICNQKITLASERNESDLELENAENNIIKNNDTIKNLEVLILGFEEAFKEIDIKRIKLKETIKSKTEELENITLLYNKSEGFKNNLQISSARLETERETLYSKLNEEMELTYAEALELRLSEDIELCKNDITRYKSEITKLGVVNLGAIEEYKELFEKYTFMKNQKDDLIKAREELLSVVKNMTDKMRIVFNKNFKVLRENFNETFKELFKGGSADLIIEEGDELTANIEINVQPPGKKLQNINLMSGGEKGLSAIALLFAILKMKPTPFCILDEIEAALDDSNVVRYAEFLRKFSNNTQFIIITHRKGSMEVGDVLYGITMEEKGVSKIVSVDLSK